MNGWLLDTNVLSELRRPKPSPAVVDFVSAQPLDRLYVSEVTVAEIRLGIELVAEPARRAELRQWLEHRLRPMFANRVLAISEDILLQWRLIIEAGRRSGHTFSHPDVLIAATAAQHGLTVVTRDTSDFAAAGVNALNPWNGAETSWTLEPMLGSHGLTWLLSAMLMTPMRRNTQSYCALPR